MAGTKEPTFAGFTTDTFRFLEDLVENNDRAWFLENKHRYEEDVLAPSLGFIAAMEPRLERISKYFLAIPKRTGGSLMRVYRDTRFSRNKAPYKTNIGIQFRHELGKDVHAPGFYVHIEPTTCFLGVGMWHPESKALSAIRDGIINDPAAWKRGRNSKRFADRFELSGDSLKRPPRGYPPEHPLIEDLKRKDFIGISEFSRSCAKNSGLVNRVAEDFAAARPWMRFLCSALDLRF